MKDVNKNMFKPEEQDVPVACSFQQARMTALTEEPWWDATIRYSPNNRAWCATGNAGSATVPPAQLEDKAR